MQFRQFLEFTGTASKNINYVLVQWKNPDPQARKQVFRSLETALEFLTKFNHSIETPEFIAQIAELDEVISNLMKDQTITPEQMSILRQLKQLIDENHGLVKQVYGKSWR